MPDYQHGKIYMLESLVGGVRYYGSTCQPLFKRMSAHRGDYKKYLAGKYNYITSFEVVKHGDVKIVWIENVRCNSKEELESREAHYIRENVCVNKCIPGAIAAAGGKVEYDAEYREANREKIVKREAEYRQANREQLLERSAEYYQANLERITERHAEYYQTHRERILEKHTCQCGGRYVTSCKSRHSKSKRHVNWLSTQPPEYAPE